MAHCAQSQITTNSKFHVARIAYFADRFVLLNVKVSIGLYVPDVGAEIVAIQVRIIDLE